MLLSVHKWYLLGMHQLNFNHYQGTGFMWVTRDNGAVRHYRATHALLMCSLAPILYPPGTNFHLHRPLFRFNFTLFHGTTYTLLFYEQHFAKILKLNSDPYWVSRKKATTTTGNNTCFCNSGYELYEHFVVFQLVVSLLLPAAWLFWFTLTTLMLVAADGCFRVKISLHFLHTGS